MSGPKYTMDMAKVITHIKEPESLSKTTDSPYMVANVQAMILDGIICAIRKEILGRFNPLKTYTIEDYEEAMDDMSELLENFGK